LKDLFESKAIRLVLEIGRLLISNNERIAIVESCTGGMLGSYLTAVPGSSQWFVGGIVAYSNEIKENVVGVSHRVLEEYGAVSRQTARSMVRGVTRLMNTENGVAITGIAGPAGGTKKKPVGTVWIAVRSKLRYKERKFLFRGERDKVRKTAVLSALKMALDNMK